MRDLAKENDDTVTQAVSDPAPEAGLSVGGAHTTDGGVRPSGFDLDSAEDDPEGPLDSVGVYHFVRLSSVSCV